MTCFNKVHSEKFSLCPFLGNRIYVVGGTEVETEQQVRVVEYLDMRTGLWSEEFILRRGVYYLITYLCTYIYIYA